MQINCYSLEQLTHRFDFRLNQKIIIATKPLVRNRKRQGTMTACRKGKIYNHRFVLVKSVFLSI